MSARTKLENLAGTWLWPIGTPDAWLEIDPYVRADPRNPLTGVFATCSPDRSNTIGFHPHTAHHPNLARANSRGTMRMLR